uniref:Ovule protein n=1 Tax=Caenorhabditis tropicalis TaxID=1561998 RepID=A0A1I7TWX7_9PELO
MEINLYHNINQELRSNLKKPAKNPSGSPQKHKSGGFQKNLSLSMTFESETHTDPYGQQKKNTLGSRRDS